MKKAYEHRRNQPFGDDIITYRVEGKIFVCLWLGGGRYDMKDGLPRFACKLPPARRILLSHHQQTAEGFEGEVYLGEKGFGFLSPFFTFIVGEKYFPI